MDASERKKAKVITKYAADAFTEGDWCTLGQITGKLKLITDHPRLLRAMGFEVDDYEYWAAQVLDEIFSADTSLIPEVIDHFDINLWYQQKEPDKSRRLFRTAATPSADFWTEGYLKLFISHLSANKFRMSVIKERLAQWSVCAFIAHEDIQASENG